MWFLTNGTLRPDPNLSERLAIWPNEGDPDDDRIVNQLMYVPLNYSQQTSEVKSIYLITDDNDWNISYGKEAFSECPVNCCEFVNESYAPFVDLIFFKYGFGEIFINLNHHKPNQIWVMFQLESPVNPNYLRDIPRDINQTIWTATYRHDSEIPTPYYKYFPYNDQNISQNIDYSLGKTKKVVWFVSNCNADNNRLEYALELQQYIDVDIYGECGQLKCEPEECLQILDKDYKFYLSFENSNCFDYITEKFWKNGLMHNVIPIVMGAHPITYKRFAPPNSYIHVEDFRSPKDLAQYLHLLDTNKDLYNEYFKWKGNGEIRNVEMWCRVCALLHASPKPTIIYKDLHNWWDNRYTCVNTSWNYKI